MGLSSIATHLKDLTALDVDPVVWLQRCSCWIVSGLIFPGLDANILVQQFLALAQLLRRATPCDCAFLQYVVSIGEA